MQSPLPNPLSPPECTWAPQFDNYCYGHWIQLKARYASAVTSVLQTSLGFIIFTIKETLAFTLFFPPPWPLAPSVQRSRQEDSPLEAQVLAWVINAQRESQWSSLSLSFSICKFGGWIPSSLPFLTLLLLAKREGDEPKCTVLIQLYTETSKMCYS